jgi:hypothetical protein
MKQAEDRAAVTAASGASSRLRPMEAAAGGYEHFVEERT